MTEKGRRTESPFYLKVYFLCSKCSLNVSEESTKAIKRHNCAAYRCLHRPWLENIQMPPGNGLGNICFRLPDIPRIHVPVKRCVIMSNPVIFKRQSVRRLAGLVWISQSVLIPFVIVLPLISCKTGMIPSTCGLGRCQHGPGAPWS